MWVWKISSKNKEDKAKQLHCPRRSNLYKLVTIEYKNNLDCYSVLSLSIFWSLSHGGSFTLYISVWTIFILHLLIIWAFSWVPVPSDTLFGFLWVVVANAVLFRGLLHINAARKVVAVHLMRWWQLSLRYFWVSFLLVCSWGMSLSLEFLGGLL